MALRLFDVSLCTQGFCLACGGTGKIRAKRKAMQFNGPPIDYDEVYIKCLSCNGTGRTDTAPRSHRTEK